MKKQEFMKMWKEISEARLRKTYKDDPHGPACLAMSLTDGHIEKQGASLWRKFGAGWRSKTTEQVEAEFKKYAKGD